MTATKGRYGISVPCMVISQKKYWPTGRLHDVRLVANEHGASEGSNGSIV